MLFHCTSPCLTWCVVLCEELLQKYIHWVLNLWHFKTPLPVFHLKTRGHNRVIVFWLWLQRDTGWYEGISLTLHSSFSNINSSVMTFPTQRHSIDTKNKRLITDKKEGIVEGPLPRIPKLHMMTCTASSGFSFHVDRNYKNPTVHSSQAKQIIVLKTSNSTMFWQHVGSTVREVAQTSLFKMTFRAIGIRVTSVSAGSDQGLQFWKWKTFMENRIWTRYSNLWSNNSFNIYLLSDFFTFFLQSSDVWTLYCNIQR